MQILKNHIRSVPDFPKTGITFYDITTLFENAEGMSRALDAMQKFVLGSGATKIVGIESRGFIVGAPLADRLKLGFVIARKQGKLPSDTIAERYNLEYGTDILEMHSDAILPGDKVAIVDDLVATGGSLLAGCRLVERLGGEVVGISCVIGLTFLGYAERLSSYKVQTLVEYDSE